MDFRLRDARLIAVSDAGVVAKEEDPTFWDVLRKQIFGPEDSILGPSFLSVPSQPVQEDDAASLASVETHLLSAHKAPRRTLPHMIPVIPGVQAGYKKFNLGSNSC
uniref:Uncharacterized protein n=1 Tax=Fusarium oxysporum (strain Fo5176) TaxID=660025 RepID=A0A0C4BKT6_FUSOF